MLASLDCNDCQTYLYKIPSGVADTYETDEGPKLQKRPKANTPPCHICPKSVMVNGQYYPDTDGETKMSQSNIELVEMVNRCDAPYYTPPEHLINDPLFAGKYAEVKRVVAECDADRSNEQLAFQLAQIILRPT